MKVFVTGSSGLIGSEIVTYFDGRGAQIVGIDNNMRADFFGREGDTTWNMRRLQHSTRRFRHHFVDIRDRPAVTRLFQAEGPFDLIVHAAAQPSHDLAASRPLDDFDVNATGTLNVLEATRKYCPEAVFVHLSTNKVYGDAPNEIPLLELETRWEYARPEDYNGIREDMRIDRSLHSVFGAGKVAADVMVQEYGRYFGIRTTALRGGCLTGPNHSGVELHGFLSYLVRCQLTGRPYRIFGHKGKQVRDNIHSLDVSRTIEAIYRNPRPGGEVYNLGGGRENACSILEAFAKMRELSGREMDHSYVEQARKGDHICYISDLRKLRWHYPELKWEKSLDDIFEEITRAWHKRLAIDAKTAVTLSDSPAPASLGGAAAPQTDKATATLATRERFRDDYQRRRDPIRDDRLLWRAQAFRHLCHILPGQTVLELGCGEGRLARQVHEVTRGANPITAVSFDPATTRPQGLPEAVEFVPAGSLEEALRGRRFDFIIGQDLLDQRNCAWLMQGVSEALNPGGQVVFWESNPWNPVLRLNRWIGSLTSRKDPRKLLRRTRLYELLSEIGFVRVFAAHNDFVYRPLPRRAMWLLRNASILLENAPVLRHLAGSIVLHGQKPPRHVPRPAVSLAEHAGLRKAVSFVIPCHNEEMNIGALITRLRELYDDYIHEIIPVDDNSRDGTREVICQLAERDPRIKPVFRDPPNGVGRAISDGLGAATGRWVLSMDCDFQHLLPEMRDLFDAAADGRYDVVVGSRFSRHSVLLNYPFMKILANRGFHTLAQVMLLRRFRDLTNNLKLMRSEVVQNLQLQRPHFAVNAETGLQPLMMGYCIKEVPISWINRTPDMGASSFRLLKVGGGYGRVLWDLWLRSFGLGAYRDLPVRGDNRKTWRQVGVAPRKPSLQQ